MDFLSFRLLGEDFEPQQDSQRNLDLAVDLDEIQEAPSFHIGQMNSPPLFQQYIDNDDCQILGWCMQKDVIWAILDALPSTVASEHFGS